MALLQISEPGMSTAPHQHRLAVGIDLGTTNSLVATVRSGLAVVLDDADGRALLPSVVRYHANGEVDVGHCAQAAQNTPVRIASNGPMRRISGVPNAMNMIEPKLFRAYRTPICSRPTPAPAVSKGATTGRLWLMKLPAICMAVVTVRPMTHKGGFIVPPGVSNPSKRRNGPGRKRYHRTPRARPGLVS